MVGPEGRDVEAGSDDPGLDEGVQDVLHGGDRVGRRSGTNLLGRCASPSTKVFLACSTGCLVWSATTAAHASGFARAQLKPFCCREKKSAIAAFLAGSAMIGRGRDVDEVAGQDVLGVDQGGGAVGVRRDDGVAVGGQRIDLVRPAERPVRHWWTAGRPRCPSRPVRLPPAPCTGSSAPWCSARRRPSCPSARRRR